jgi:hypothetical protein
VDADVIAVEKQLPNVKGISVRVLAIDPGRCSGYCYAAFQKGELYFVPFQMVDDVEDLWNRIRKFDPKHIVCEDFEFRGGARKGLDLFPVQLIGVVRLWHATHSTSLTLQKASVGKSYYSDATLKQLDLYQRGNEHGRDASRHLLQWATFGSGYKYVQKKTNFAHLVELGRFAP